MYYYLLELTYQLKSIFSFIALHSYIRSTAFYLSISFNSKVLENNISFSFGYWFWLVYVVMLTKERHGEHKKIDRKTYIFK